MQRALRLSGLPLHDWRPNALGVDGQRTWECRMTPVRHNGITHTRGVRLSVTYVDAVHGFIGVTVGDATPISGLQCGLSNERGLLRPPCNWVDVSS